MPAPALNIPSRRGQVSPEEWRCASTWPPPTASWPCSAGTTSSSRTSAPGAGRGHRFLINPYGLMFEEITASSLVTVDTDGRKLDDSPFDVNPAGFTIHSAVHAARDDAICVLHTHSLNGVAVSAQKGGVLPLSQQSIFVLGSLGYHDYEGVALRDDEKPRLVRDLGTTTS
jgi:ribulose-5-phosphate 4-epimerase/fuculose-1-phosphate aldolase